MPVTVGSLTIRALQDFPVAHGGDSLQGRTARKFPVKAVLSPADWLTLNSIYTTWRNARINDPDTFQSLSVGTTVATSGQVYGYSWSNVAAWFSQPPAATPLGGMVGVSFELIAAYDHLQLIKREKETALQLDDTLADTFGTVTIGGITLTLISSPIDYEDVPRMELAGTGTSVIRGTLAASQVQKIQGWTHDSNAEQAIRDWYEATIASLPAAGDFWPISGPRFSHTPVIVSGARLTRTVVSLDLKQVR